MKTCDLRNLGIQSLFNDRTVCLTAVFTILFSIFLCAYFSLLFGVSITIVYCAGIGAATLLLQQRKHVAQFLQYAKEILGFKEFIHDTSNDCDVCGTNKCKRHVAKIIREPWKGIFIDKELDQAVDRFYTKILKGFVESWFSLLSKDEDFVHSLKENLREATSRLILKLKKINIPLLITEKLLPCTFTHYEIVQQMIRDGIPLGRLAKTAILNERPIHPACINRQCELDYLRAVATILVPRLCCSEHFSSKVFFSLVRELMACWVLLPLMDALANPNLINALVIIATNNTVLKLSKPSGERVVFLEDFIRKRVRPLKINSLLKCEQNSGLLTNQNQLYAFMQFLKKEGAVDVLRFYLDVDNLNSELLDPKVTTDPAKLSSLYKQSENLLKTYNEMMKITDKHCKQKTGDTNQKTLAEAHEHVKQLLLEKWEKRFRLTPEYFQLVYGCRTTVTETHETVIPEPQSMFRLGSKIKGAIRGAIDGQTIEATEVPTVWDAFTDEHGPSNNSNTNIYNSVTQKLRKERGQNLENFIVGFMQSIEPSVTDVGEDVINKLSNTDVLETNKIRKSTQSISLPPGQHLVFGDLFELRKSTKYNTQTLTGQHHPVKGPSQCLIYILVRVIKTPLILLRFTLAMINISQKFVDSLLCKLIDHLIKVGVYQPRLTVLITHLEQSIFNSKSEEESPSELHERQRQARLRLDGFCSGLGAVSDVLQSPPLNKHLMYCLLDIILCEIYPELDHIV